MISVRFGISGEDSGGVRVRNAVSGVLLALIWACTLLPVGTAAAAPGDIDRSFGENGVLELRSSAGGADMGEVVDLALGPQDEIFVLGVSRQGCSPWVCTTLHVTKYGADGVIDGSFDSRAGLADALHDAGSFELMVDGRGRILLIAGLHTGIAVTRLDPQGQLDRAFGVDGHTFIDMGGPVVVGDAEIGLDEELAVGGYVMRFNPHQADVFIARILHDGRPDLGFAGSGVRVIELMSWDFFGGLALLGGEVALAGTSAPNCCYEPWDPKVVTFSPSGDFIETNLRWPRRLDSASGRNRLRSPVPRPGGGVDLIGTGKFGTFVSSFRRDWTVVPRVGRGGTAFISGFFVGGSGDAARDTRGRLVLGGITAVPGTDSFGAQAVALALTRRLPDGRLDRSFAAGGRQTSPYVSREGSLNVSKGVVVQSGGQIVVLGARYPECVRACSGQPFFALTRYVGGDSKARCRGHRATVVGTRRSEVIAGSHGRDVIAALGGSDTVYGRGGKDLICGSRGVDTLQGGPGDDSLFGGRGQDTLVGGGGGDRLKGGPGADSHQR